MNNQANIEWREHVYETTEDGFIILDGGKTNMLAKDHVCYEGFGRFENPSGQEVIRKVADIRLNPNIPGGYQWVQDPRFVDPYLEVLQRRIEEQLEEEKK